MDRERAKELLPIMQAYAEGKTIQYRVVGYEDWHDVDDRRRLIVGFGENFVEIGNKPVTMQGLFETYTFLDGSPCGVKED